jgi:peptidyl-dipeptidase Dcp
VPNVPGWHPDVRTFKVLDADGSELAIFLADYFARPSKRSGAWMSALQSGHGLGEGSSPIIYNVMNFAKPPAGEPALLSLDEAKTLFHEFGHALHGMLTRSPGHPSRHSGLAGLGRAAVAALRTLADGAGHSGKARAARQDRQADAEGPAGKTVGARLRSRTTPSNLPRRRWSTGPIMAGRSAEKEPLAFEAETLKQLAAPAVIPMRHRTRISAMSFPAMAIRRVIVLHVVEVGSARR